MEVVGVLFFLLEGRRRKKCAQMGAGPVITDDGRGRWWWQKIRELRGVGLGVRLGFNFAGFEWK